MPPLTDKPRHERFCVNFVSGMTAKDAALQAGFAESTALSCSEILENPMVKDRILELQTDHAQKLINAGAVATLEERKQILSKILRTKPEGPVSAGHIIAAAKEVNLMERVYQDGSSGKPGIVNITYVFNQVNSAQSAQSLPEPAKVIEIEASNSTITNIVRTSEASNDGYKA